MIRYAIYLFVFLSLINFADKIIHFDVGHLGVAAVLVFMSLAAFIMSTDD